MIGEIRSGAPSPTLGSAIARAYLEVAYTESGTQASVDDRGKPLPFYKIQE